MRSCAWLICLAGCGRIGFDTAADAASSDATGGDAGVPLVTVDPASLPPFESVQLVTALSSGADDDDPDLTRDQLEVFFDSHRAGSSDLWTARRATVTDGWSAPDPISVLNTVANEEHPAISQDLLTLYFTSNRTGDADVWFATRPDRSSPFGAPFQLANVNTTIDGDRMGSIDALDLSLFLASERGAAFDRLYESRRSGSAAAWPSPVLVPEVLTTAGDPSVHVDDRALAMYLVQDAMGSDLFWTKRTMPGAAWAATVPLVELNTPAAETDPWLSPDLRVIYFVRDTGPGTKDIYMATR